MREIKFRAWDKKATSFVKEGGIMLSLSGKLMLDDIQPSVEPERYILMQFTGLKDKNGKEIWEGDIVKKKNGILGEVKFGEYCFTGDEYSVQGIGFYIYSNPKGMFGVYDFPTKSEEIIGNIYENPNLIN